jgi:hypothetical protein
MINPNADIPGDEASVAASGADGEVEGEGGGLMAPEGVDIVGNDEAASNMDEDYRENSTTLIYSKRLITAFLFSRWKRPQSRPK